MFVWIRPDGTLHLIYDDAARGLLALGLATIRRASYVEPTSEGRWTADLGLMAGPRLGPFETRAAALEAEQTWLVHHFTGRHPQEGASPCVPSH